VSATKSPWVIDVNEADFEKAVLEASRQRPVVVDFWAPWCGPCRALGPILERLAEERNGDFLLAKVNTDENQRLAMEFDIQGIPAVKAIRDGRVVLEFEGLLPEQHLRAFIDQITPSAADRKAEEAAKLEATDPAKAEAEYRQALAGDRPPDEARVGLARLLLARGADDEASDLLEAVGPSGEVGAEAARLKAQMQLKRRARDLPDEATLRRGVEAEPDNAQARYGLGVVLAAAGRYEEALPMLLSAAERDPKLARSAVREAMVEVFHAVGVRSPLADEYRDKLTKLLY
jgi:putative thioredoxin